MDFAAVIPVLLAGAGILVGLMMGRRNKRIVQDRRVYDLNMETVVKRHKDATSSLIEKIQFDDIEEVERSMSADNVLDLGDVSNARRAAREENWGED